jgi:hypothetical protein
MAGGAGGAVGFDVLPVMRPTVVGRAIHHHRAVAFVAEGEVN